MRNIRCLLLMMLISGCSSTRQVSFESEPPGATVRIGGEEYITPCVIDLSEETTTVEMALGPEQVMLVDVPEGYDFWDRTGEVAGTAGAYALYGIATPLLAVGILGESALAGGYDGGEPYAGLVIVAGAVSGKLVGDFIALTGESLEEGSHLEDHSILVVFPVTSPTPDPSLENDDPESFLDPTLGGVRGTPIPSSSTVERSLLN